MYKLINRIKALIFFLPTIWGIGSWDYEEGTDLFVKYLEFLAKGIRKRNIHANACMISAEIDTFIRMYNKYNTDPHFIDYVKICKESKSEEEQAKAFENYTYLNNYDKEELFNYLRDNIEKWWD